MLKRVPIAALTVGSVLARPLYDGDGRKLLGEGIPITEEFLFRLARRGVQSVLLNTSDLPASAALAPQPRTRAIPENRPGVDIGLRTAATLALDWFGEDAEALRLPTQQAPFAAQVQERGLTTYSREEQAALVEQHEMSLKALDDFGVSVLSSRSFDIQQVLTIAATSVSQAASDLDLYTCLSINPSAGDYPARHSLHVSKLAVAMGIRLGYDVETLRHLSVGCLIHDVGMRVIDQSLVTQKRRLADTEFVEIAKHPFKTFELLEKNLDAVPMPARMVAYQMHERSDASGYPRRRKLESIHELARVAAVADAYVALVTPRPYRSGVIPHFALRKVIEDVKLGRYEPKVVRALLNTISLFPLGSLVELSDGRRGHVLRCNKEQYDRPIVQAWTDGSGPSHSTIVDLATEPQLKVVRALADSG